MDSILIPAASAESASAQLSFTQCSVFHAPMSDAWRAARADRHVTPAVPSNSDATFFTVNSIDVNSIAATTSVVRGASAELVSSAGRLAYGAAKRAAPPRGRLR
ncbi:hypothetical protein [uncultured Jatrophihabitans sp.]|uniref:hypothetical protein n=1 Tax=uncultured Jatrophihabitans sp. TaxID=1610747 RepID=UPI0035CAF3D9